MNLSPRHRLRLDPPGAQAACIQAGLRAGAHWLHSGDTGEDLLAWTGPRLISRWNGSAWQSELDGVPRLQSPWSALESVVPTMPGPWIGAASYELACDEAGLPHKPLLPGCLGQSWGAVIKALHWKEGVLEGLSWEPEPPTAEAWMLCLGRLAQEPAEPPTQAPLPLRPAWDQGTHRQAVLRIQECILDGGFYVANLCVPFHGDLRETAEELAARTLGQARTPFGALLNLGDLRLLSLSMERLLSRRGNHLRSQPIKGSAPRTGDPITDQKTGSALAADPKERAEHTMIVDLVRNDLGRVALAGTVQVSRCMALEPYPTVLHLVSTVEAEARPGLGLADLLRAVLPGGSVTGAPKHAVCGHLAAAEAAPRGFYCGALGWVSANGDLDLALPIRTAQIAGSHLTYWTGGGITRRSDPEREWQELFLKTRTITS
ncbi:MAG TPA: anthranilate synthase component I family protein [Geothrix sp.]|nr:anthranilate synthase component I family protein [Geothrix sp.]